jgi:DNA gyrase subunit A
VRGINRYGRASQGVRVMNLREGDVVSAVALVVESDTSTAASAAALDEGVEGVAELDGAGVGEPDDPGAEGPEVTEETDEDEA